MRTLLPLNTAAERLGVSTDTLLRWTKAGRVACYRLPGGGHRRWEATELDAFLDTIHLPATLTVSAAFGAARE